jgi:1-acyl-sn-glycerol-3-phosphate acyltransferase
VGFYRLIRRLFLILARPAFRFRVEGREHVPLSGPGILVAPHRSWLDPAVVGAACPRPVHFMILKGVYEKPWARWFYRKMRSLPVEPGGNASISALRGALRHLRSGELIGIFPEGRVVTDEAESVVHPGAALLAVRSGARVIPMEIRGSDVAWPKGQKLPRPASVSVTIGPGLDPPARGSGVEIEEMTRRIERALLPARRR